MSEMNGCQGASGSEELEVKELRGAAGDLEPKVSPFSVYMVNPSFFIYYKGSVPSLKEWCSSTNIRFRSIAPSTRAWSLLSQRVLIFR